MSYHRPNLELTTVPGPDLPRITTRMRENILQTTRFNPSELCSRKLWQIVNSEQAGPLDSADLQRAISELAARRHYLGYIVPIPLATIKNI